MVSAAVVLSKAELPLAVVDLTGTLLVCVWKTLGLAFLPGWNDMFGRVGEGKQYPVRNHGSWPVWVELMYLSLYGVLGSYAQFGSLQMAKEEEESSIVTDATIRRSKVLGLFHTILAGHHLAWAVSGTWGRLDLSEYAANLPLAKVAIGVSSAWMGCLGVKLLKTDKGSSYAMVRRQKRVLDAASFVSMIPTFLFLPANWVGYRNKTFETAAWATVPYGILGLLGWSAIDQAM